jgi:hypothetical protein
MNKNPFHQDIDERALKSSETLRKDDVKKKNANDLFSWLFDFLLGGPTNSKGPR